MGLDMYLYGGVEAPAESAIAKVIEEHMTEEVNAHLSDPEYDNSEYISGWAWKGEPDALYGPLCLEMGFTPDEGSPHIYLERRVDGYFVKPIVMYWRKANEIHRWFVERCQNGVDECQESPVHPEMLAEFLDHCERITAADGEEKQRLAEELLPTQGGFFFGGTEYNDYYFQGIAETAVELKAQVEALMHLRPKFYYRASW